MNSLDAAASKDLKELERAVAEMCVRVPVSAGASGLARELALIAPQLTFRNMLTRGGWYRLGGVVDDLGTPLSDDLAKWMEDELAAHDDDLHVLVDAYAESGLKATRIVGKTHYLVASTGRLAADFVQIEIEELQEVIGHELFSGEVPGSLEELIDPSHTRTDKSVALPLDAPFYSLRRITNVAEFLKRMAAQKPEPQTVNRFFEAWQSSSAGYATLFSNHWVVAVREYLDRYRQSILQATPVAAVNGLPPKFESTYGARGLGLHDTLQRFDRQAGYPMAWFFHMLTTKSVPHAVASAVIEDVLTGFNYLPERDVKVVRDWLHRPYGF
jgi:hypothetical protein